MKTTSKNIRSGMLITLTLCGLGLAACNTMEGAGKDVKEGGRSLENSARENKTY